MNSILLTWGNDHIPSHLLVRIQVQDESDILHIQDEYDRMVDEFGFTVFDGTKPVETQQKELRKLVKSYLKNWEGMINPNKNLASELVSTKGGQNDEE